MRMLPIRACILYIQRTCDMGQAMCTVIGTCCFQHRYYISVFLGTMHGAWCDYHKPASRNCAEGFAL